MTGLRSQIVEAVADRPLTAQEIAMRLRVRRAAVDEVLHAGGFRHAETPEGGSRRATYWTVAADTFGTSGRVLSQTGALLALLSDRDWHDSASLYQVATVPPARIRELEARGYRIERRRDGRRYEYRLAGSVLDEQEPQTVGAPARPGTGGGSCSSSAPTRRTA